MSDSVTMASMVAEVRRLGGFETLDQANAFATDAEIESRINRNGRRVYNALVKARGANYFRTQMSPAITTSAGTSAYNLPAAFLQLLEVSLDRGGGRYEPLLEYTRPERHGYEDADFAGSGSFRYQLQAGKLNLVPAPRGTHTIEVWYVPAYTNITGTQTFDGISGFEEWAIWLTVADLKHKDQDDPSYALSQAAWWESEVQALARQRDAANPPRVARTRRLRRLGML